MSKAETSKPTDNKDSKPKNEVIENLRSINKGEYVKQCIIPFRDLLNEIKKDTNADLEELAEGLGLSRQTVIQFLNDEDEDNPYQPPIGRINIITLWQTLTDKSIYLKRERAKKKLQPVHETARSNFRKNGLNRMLTTMGFQAIGVIDGNNLSKASIEKAYRIVSSLSSDRVTDEVVWKIEDSISEQILNSIINKNESKSTIHVSEEAILNALKDYEENEAEGSKISDENENRFKLAIKRCKNFGKKEFNEVEILELFHSIKQKTLEREEVGRESKINVVNCEIKSLDYYHQELNKSIESESSESEKAIIKEIINDINKLGQKVKCELEQIEEFSAEVVEPPMKEVRVNCLNLLTGAKFSWVYRSNYTNIKNILSAITRGIGIKASLKDLTIKTLSSGNDSLVKVSCTVNFGDKENIMLQRGYWIDIDILTCIAQSFMCASEQWIKRNNLQISIQNIYIKIDSIYRLICEARNALYNYRTKISSERNNDNITELNSQNTLEEIIKEIQKQLKEIKIQVENDKKNELYFHYLAEFFEYADQYSQLLKLRSLHINGKCESANELLENFKKTYLDGERKEIGYIRLMYDTEDILNKAFRGDFELLDQRLWYKNPNNCFEGSFFDQSQKRIRDYIINLKEDELVIHTTSLYYSLSEFYGNWSRLDFYFSKKEHEEQFKKSINGFLIAAYFSLQNDNGIRFSYWLCHAARSHARLGNIKQAFSTLNIAKNIIESSFKPGDNDKYRKGMMSTYSLAISECRLFEDYKNSKILDIKDNTKSDLVEHINVFLDALTGFYIIGFERLMYDALYNIYRLLTIFNNMQLSDQKNEIIIKFQNIFNDDEVIKKIINENAPLKATSDSDKEDNKDLFVEFIHYVDKAIKSESSDLLSEIAEKSKSTVRDKWMSWFERDPNDPKRSHPICVLIDDEVFLGRFF